MPVAVGAGASAPPGSIASPPCRTGRANGRRRQGGRNPAKRTRRPAVSPPVAISLTVLAQIDLERHSANADIVDLTGQVEAAKQVLRRLPACLRSIRMRVNRRRAIQARIELVAHPADENSVETRLHVNRSIG